MRPDRSASNRAILAVVMAGALLAGAAVPPARADVPAGRLPTDVIPTFQSVDLTLDADSADYSGSVRVELRVSRATDAIRFHAKDMDLHRVALRGPKGEVALTPTVGDQAIVTATAGGPIAPGSYTLTVEFSNDFDRRAAGLYRLRTGGHWYAFTQLEAIDARKAFPCWDEPSFKFPYQITLHVPERHRAVSNTPVERETVADGVRTVVFKRTKPLPSYLLAIATGPFEFVPIPGLRVPGRIVTVQGASALAQVAVKMTPPLFDALESYFGIPYPYEKLDLIAVPEFSPGAMENPGAITYGDRFLLFDERTMSVEQRRTLATFTAHEISHMWFGDLVTMKWWDDLWLNESFAEWMGDKIAGQVYPDLAVGPNALLEGQQAYAIDALLSTRAIRQPVTNMENLLEAADVLAYRKGQIVLGMTERWLGPEVFRKGIVSYLKAHAWGNAEGRDLWNALAKASGKDVPGVLGSFLDQPGVPMVDVAVDPAGRVTLSQRRFLHYGATAPDSALWKIPVSLSWPDGGTRRTETVVLDRRRMTVALPRGAGPAWVHPNVEEAGYYRWSLDAASFRGLIAAAPRALDTRERIGVIENASALLDAGAIHGDQYVEILGGFADDESPLVVSSLFGGLGLVKNAFVTPDLEDPFASFVRRTLTPALRRFGIARRPNEDEAVSLLRPQLINWLADDGRDAAVLAVADSLARSFLNDRGSVDPSLVGTALLTTAIHGDSTLFGEFRRRFETTEVPTDRPDYLSALGNFHDPALRKDALDYALHGPLRPHELFTIPSVMAGTPEFRDETWAWWMENYDSVTSRMPPEYAVYVPYMAGGCDAARLEQAKTFFADPKHAPPGTLKELAKLSESVGDCVGLRGREGAAVARLLRESARMP
ncbi:MAG TPA: M1 family metallopeptidase [Candidatus Eisenbacteria bacterium]